MTASWKLAPLLVALVIAVQAAPAAAQTTPAVETLRIEPATGGATTPFFIDLPDGATCPGDSANDGYRVNTYLVPASVDPHEVVYDGLGPRPNALGDYDSFRQPLYDVESTFYVSGQTAEAEELGGPGLILDLPPFDFAVFGEGDLPAGTYNIGVVCTLLNDIERIWGSQIVITGSGPEDLRWTVTGQQLAESSSPVPVAVVPLIGGALVLLGLAIYWRRSDHRTNQRSEP